MSDLTLFHCYLNHTQRVRSCFIVQFDPVSILFEENKSNSVFFVSKIVMLMLKADQDIHVHVKQMG